MRIEKLSECKGGNALGTCTECGENNRDKLQRIRFTGASICLCDSCFNKTFSTATISKGCAEAIKAEVINGSDNRTVSSGRIWVSDVCDIIDRHVERL